MPHFKDLENILSFISPEATKGWLIHKKMILNYVDPGKIKLVLYDLRENHQQKANLWNFLGLTITFLSVSLLVWNGFKGIGSEISIVTHCATSPHDPDEIERLDPFTDKIPYNWNIKQR